MLAREAEISFDEFMGRRINTQIASEDRRPKNFQDRKTLASHPEGLGIALIRPRIPQNAGSIARMCAATGSTLDLVEPFFQIDDRKLKRAGLDYWPYLDVFNFDSIEAWQIKRASRRKCFVELGSDQLYTEFSFARGDLLVFGDEEEGIPKPWLEEAPQAHISIPQKNVRSLNLATSVGIVTYEALGQLGWYSIKDSLRAGTF